MVGRPALALAAGALVTLLAGCAGHGRAPTAAGPVPGPQGYYKVGAPYQVDGVWYRPHVDWSYDQTGTASWYGKEFHGHLTANGEIFDLNGLTAAHPTLPLPSIVEVTDLDDGRQIRLRVNDRGPYVNGRVIDVSRRAAQLLGFEMAGTAHVRVRLLAPETQEAQALARRDIIGNTAVAAAAPRPAATPPASAPLTVADATMPALAPPPVEAQTPPPAIAPTPARAPTPAPAPWAAAPPPRPAPPMTTALAPADEVPASRIESPEVPPFGPGARRPVVAEASPPPRSFAPPRPPAPVRAAAAAAANSGGIYIQAGAFAEPGNARRLKAKLDKLGRVEVSGAEVRGVTLYRVRIGPMPSVDAADRLLNRVVDSGVAGARIVAD